MTAARPILVGVCACLIGLGGYSFWRTLVASTGNHGPSTDSTPRRPAAKPVDRGVDSGPPQTSPAERATEQSEQPTPLGQGHASDLPPVVLERLKRFNESEDDYYSYQQSLIDNKAYAQSSITTRFVVRRAIGDDALTNDLLAQALANRTPGGPDLSVEDKAQARDHIYEFVRSVKSEYDRARSTLPPYPLESIGESFRDLTKRYELEIGILRIMDPLVDRERNRCRRLLEQILGRPLVERAYIEL